jgi:hypothetical protein
MKTTIKKRRGRRTSGRGTKKARAGFTLASGLSSLLAVLATIIIFFVFFVTFIHDIVDIVPAPALRAICCKCNIVVRDRGRNTRLNTLL